MVLSQDLAYAFEEAIAAGLRQVSRLDQGRVASAARAADRDHRLSSGDALRDQKGLVVWLIDGVDHDVGFFGEYFIAGSLGVEALLGVDHNVGRDRAHTLGQDVDFGVAYGGSGSMDLSVGIAQADLVEIDQGQRSDPRARERLYRPGTYPSHTYHDDMTRFDRVACAHSV